MDLNKFFSQLLKLNVGATISIISFLVFTACSEDPLKIGTDVLPEDEMLGAIIDTLPVELFTVATEAIETKSLGTSLLGSVNDPVMGTLETDFFADFIYVDEPTFKDETDLDSILVLDLTVDLVYNNNIIYGNLDTLNFQFNVYELLEPVPQYSKSDFTVLPHMYDPEPLNTAINFTNKTHSSYVTNDFYDTCHVTLSNTYAQRFLDTVLINDEIYHSENQRNFKEQFKGFYFAVTPPANEGGSIISINQSSSIMTLRTLEWNTDSTKWDTVSNVFSVGNSESAIDSGGVHLTMYRGMLSAEVEAVFNDTITQTSKAYIQSLTGPQVYVKLPTLADFREQVGSSVSVIRAQLVLPIDMENYHMDHELYTPPYRMGLLDGHSKEPILDDLVAENHLLGYIDSTYTDSLRYILNIGNHLHEYTRDVTSELSNTFYLFAASSDTKNSVQYLSDRPERIVLNGSRAGSKPFVRIIYSIIPQ
jgi:hypothetical protein